jgi:transposase
MSNRRIEMYEYQQIIYRLQQGQTIREIAREGLASRTKVKEIKAIAAQEGWLLPGAITVDESELGHFFSKKLPYPQESKAAMHAEMIKTWLQQGIQASVIYQHLKDNYGFTGAYNSVQRFTQKIKIQDPKQLTVPLHFQPAEAAQVDFGKGPSLFDERTGRQEDSWFFIMTLCWSRHQYARLITHQDIETWLDCHQNAFYWFGGVVNKVIIDNPKCAITTACYYDPQVQRSYEAFAQAYGFVISACPPRDPKKKGRVESGVKFIKRSFLPLRDFKTLQEANIQLQEWILGTAGNRIHGSTFEQPLKRFTEIERQLLKPLPATPPEIAIWLKALLYKNCHVRYAKNYYSAPYHLYNKELWVKVTSTTVSIYYQYELVAKHARLFKAGEYSTQNDHLPPRAQAFFSQDKEWCLAESKAIGEAANFVVTRLLSDNSKDLLRAAQGIIRLRNSYGSKRLELACKRAISFDLLSYNSIKKILASGSDYEAIIGKEAVTTLGAAYRGEGLYQRQSIKVG